MMRTTLRSAPAWAALAALLLVTACSGGSGDRQGGDKVDFPMSGTSASGTTVATGGRITVVRDQRLMLRKDSGEEQPLLRTPAGSFPTYPVWSPDGSRIAFAQAVAFTGRPNEDFGGDVYVVDASGANHKLIAKHDQPGAEVYGLTWTPDGSALLVGYQVTLIKDGKLLGQTRRLDRVDVTSGQRTTLLGDALYPSVSRDGSRMAYMTQDTSGKVGLWVAALDGSGAKQVLETGAKLVAIMYPRISPDGATIAFAAVETQAAQPVRRGGGLIAAVRGLLLPRTAAAHGVPMDVWRLNVADGTTARLTNFAEDEPFPAWSPDGRMLTVIGGNGMYELQADGANIKKIGQGAFGGQLDVR
jgi:Tol biopolymer transport system component